jgi:protein TonB
VTTREEAPSANDRLKNRFQEIFALSLILAATAHFLVFQMWPEMSATIWSDSGADSVIVVVLPDIPLPAPPPRLDRPVAPIPTADAPIEATMPAPDWQRVAELPPPPPPPAEGVGEARPDFVAFEVAPRLTNPAEFERALERAYPASLRDAGVGGTVVLLVHIDEEGQLTEARLGQSSGYGRLDEAALGLVEVMRFTPALNRDRHVAVWVSLPIAFRTRQAPAG